MNKFNIYTVCTENYRDAMMFAVPSWTRLASVEKIYIYTDFDVEFPSDKVVIVNKLPRTDDWLEVVGLRAVMLKDLLATVDMGNFAFIDIDCFIVQDIAEVFDHDFDVCATRMLNRKTANAGVWFARHTDRVERFAAEWCKLQTWYRKRKRGVRKWAPSYSQRSFSDILHREYHKKTYLKVACADERIYNYEDDDIKSWVEGRKKHNPKVLHFKGRRWRDPEALKIFA